MKHFHRSERAQSLLEFVVIFPILILLLFSILDVGLAMSRRSTLQHAVREGARYAATRDNADDGAFVVNRTVSQSQGLLKPSDVSICYAELSGDDEQDPGDAVDVTGTYTYTPFIFRMALNWFNASAPDIDMTVTGSARLEEQITVDGRQCDP